MLIQLRKMTAPTSPAALTLALLLVVSAVAAAPGPRQCSFNQVLFYAHERNCDMYYRCENGTLREEMCSDGLVFDDRVAPERAHCDLPRDIDCRNRVVLQPAQPSTHCPRRYGVYSHESDCSKFWMCMDGQSFAFSCPPGLAYDEASGNCDWPDLVARCNAEAVVGFRCPATSVRELHKQADPRYPFPGDCRKHFVCVRRPDGTRRPRLHFCDPPTAFEPKSGNCEPAEKVPGCQSYYKKRQLGTSFGR